MNLSEIKTLQDVASEYKISVNTLQQRLTAPKSALIENVDYKKLGNRMPTILSPEGVQKIIVRYR